VCRWRDSTPSSCRLYCRRPMSPRPCTRAWWPCVCDEMSQQATQLRKGKKLGRQNWKEKKSHSSECPLRVDTHWPVCAFQILTVLSPLPLAIFVPHGL
jgi:hypothetical protein